MLCSITIISQLLGLVFTWLYRRAGLENILLKYAVYLRSQIRKIERTTFIKRCLVGPRVEHGSSLSGQIRQQLMMILIHL